VPILENMKNGMTGVETRKYQIRYEAAGGRKIKVVEVSGQFTTDQQWRDAAAVVAGVEVDASFAAENVLRIFPVWLQ
jgi:hypothetical protein